MYKFQTLTLFVIFRLNIAWLIKGVKFIFSPQPDELGGGGIVFIAVCQSFNPLTAF